MLQADPESPADVDLVRFVIMQPLSEDIFLVPHGNIKLSTPNAIHHPTLLPLPYPSYTGNVTSLTSSIR